MIGKPVLETSLVGHSSCVYSVCFSPDLTKLCSVGMDEKVFLWDLRSNQPRNKHVELPGHYGTIYSVDCSSNGQLFATGSADNTIRLWDSSGGENEGKSCVVKGHVDDVNCVQFSHDGKKLVSGSGDEKIKVWNVERRAEGCSLSEDNCVFSVDILSDDRTILGGDFCKIKLWDLSCKRCIHTFEDHSSIVLSVQFHPTSPFFVSSGADRCIKLYDLRTFKVLQNYEKHGDSVESVCFHPTGKYVVSGSDDKTIKIFDLTKKKVIFTLFRQQSSVNSVRFSSDGTFFATGNGDKKVILWRSSDIVAPWGIPSREDITITKMDRKWEEKFSQMREEMERMRIQCEKMEEQMKILTQAREIDKKNVLELREKNEELEKKLGSALNYHHHHQRKRYSILKSTVSPPPLNNNNKNYSYYFLNDCVRYEFFFSNCESTTTEEEEEEINSTTSTTTSIDFSSFRVLLNDEIIAKNDENNNTVRILDAHSVSFEVVFAKIGRNELRIEFENIVERILVHVETPTHCQKNCELRMYQLLFPGGEKEEELSRQRRIQQEIFSVGDDKDDSSIIQICVSFSNENGIPLRFDHICDDKFQFTAKLVHEGQRRGIRDVLSRCNKVEKGFYERYGEVVVSTIGEKKKLGPGKYIVSVADLPDFVKSKSLVLE